MGRQVLLYLTHFFKRLQEVFTAPDRNQAATGTSPLAILIMIALSVYIAGGLGFFVKTHYWDHLTEAQKSVVIASMASSDQML